MLLASTKKRFIAGARCPACEEEDSIQLWAEGEEQVFECELFERLCDAWHEFDGAEVKAFSAGIEVIRGELGKIPECIAF